MRNDAINDYAKRIGRSAIAIDFVSFRVGYDDTRVERKKRRQYVVAKHRACCYRIMYERC